MIKHILGQGLWQAFILFFIVFGGHTFVPEGVEGPNNTDPAMGLTKDQVLAHPEPKYAEWDGKYVMTGML